MSASSAGTMPPLVSHSATTSAPASAAARTHLQRVRRVGPVAVEEVLGVEEDPLALRAQVRDGVAIIARFSSRVVRRARSTCRS